MEFQCQFNHSRACFVPTSNFVVYFADPQCSEDPRNTLIFDLAIRKRRETDKGLFHEIKFLRDMRRENRCRRMFEKVLPERHCRDDESIIIITIRMYGCKLSDFLRDSVYGYLLLVFPNIFLSVFATIFASVDRHR